MSSNMIIGLGETDETVLSGVEHLVSALKEFLEYTICRSSWTDDVSSLNGCDLYLIGIFDDV